MDNYTLFVLNQYTPHSDILTWHYILSCVPGGA